VAKTNGKTTDSDALRAAMWPALRVHLRELEASGQITPAQQRALDELERRTAKPEITDLVLAYLADALFARADSSQGDEEDARRAALLRSVWAGMRANHAAFLAGDPEAFAREVVDEFTGERSWTGKRNVPLDVEGCGLPADLVTALGTGQFIEHGGYGQHRKLVKLVLTGSAD